MSDETAPVRSHRRTGPPRSRTGRILWRTGQTAAILATLAVGSAITGFTPDGLESQKPFVRTGHVGQAVDARTFTVTVLGVQGGAVIQDLDGDHDTSGVWIVVKVRAAADTDPTLVSYDALVDADGRVYFATTRFYQAIPGGWTLEPGVPVTAEIAFEVPAAAATHLDLQLANQEDDRRMDAVAQIPLPITAADVRAWRIDKTPLVLAPVTVAP